MRIYNAEIKDASLSFNILARCPVCSSKLTINIPVSELQLDLSDESLYQNLRCESCTIFYSFNKDEIENAWLEVKYDKN